jgi:hypothetical protein
LDRTGVKGACTRKGRVGGNGADGAKGSGEVGVAAVEVDGWNVVSYLAIFFLQLRGRDPYLMILLWKLVPWGSMELGIELGVAVRGLVLWGLLVVLCLVVVRPWRLRRAVWGIGVVRRRLRLTARVWMRRSPFSLLGYTDSDDLIFLKV